MNRFSDLSNECLKEVNGGVNWGKVGSGTWDALVGTGEMYGGRYRSS